MTTATKTKKAAPRRTAAKAKTAYPPLPPTAAVVDVGGRECVIVPLDEYDDWFHDAMLAAIMAERLASDEELIPMEEVDRRLDAAIKRRS